MIPSAVYVDTSGILATLDEEDRWHEPAAATWRDLVHSGTRLVSSSYVLVETCALVQRRLGLEALRAFAGRVLPHLQMVWVAKALHDAGLVAVLVTGRRDLNLVDCVSFAVMRDVNIGTAFAFDAHFAEQGFRCLPSARS